MKRFSPPATLPVALFLLGLVLLFFGPSLWPAEGQALGNHDMRGLFYPWLEQVRLALFRGELPWWDSSRFSDYPFLSNPQVAIFYPPTWLAIGLPTRAGISLYLALHLWVAGLGVYLLARDWLDRGLAGEAAAVEPGWRGGLRTAAQAHPGPLLAAVTFLFGGFFTARLFAGHMGLIAVHAWIPWLLWTTWWTVGRKGSWQRAPAAGLVLALAILAGHTTSLLYVGLIWGLFILFLFAAERPPVVPALGRLALIGLAAAVLSAGALLPLVEFSRLAARTTQTGFEFATDFSFPPAHLVTLLVPEYFGEPLRAGYWSVPNFEELTAYIGLLPWMGALLALARPRRKSWFLLGLIILGVLLAFGRYGFLYRLFYDWIPPFRLARAPGRAMFLAAFGGSLLLADGLSHRPLRERLPPWWGRAVWGGLLLGVGAMAATGAVFAAQHPSDTSGRLWHQLGGWGWATLLVGTAGWLLSRWLSDGRPRWVWALVGLVVIDLWTFGYKLRQVNPMTPAGVWYEARDLLAETAHGRILPWGMPIFEQNGAGQLGLDSVFGYNALEVGRYAALVGSVPDPRATSFDLLGATHVVAPVPLDQFTGGERPLTLVAQAGQTWIYSRSRPLPEARLTGRAEVIANPAQAIERLHQPEFDPTTAAIVDRPVDCAAGGEPAGHVEIVEKRPGYWRIAVEADRPALLAVGETAYPGWRAAVDGQPVDWVTTYGALRGVCVPAGRHEVVWTFRPNSLFIGGLISLLGWFFLAGWWWVGRRSGPA